MKLKKLELIGFKSFYDKTTFDFSAGVTAIVGPNGCGKSNIVDAVRWVLGEHAPSYLRSKALEDVIFAGSDAAGPLGMAEVTLTFLNDDGNVLRQRRREECIETFDHQLVAAAALPHLVEQTT